MCIIHKRGLDRIRRGHLWVYRSDILNKEDAMPGSVVALRDERGKVYGKAFYSSKSQIALRLLTRNDVEIDDAFFRERFNQADQLRERLGVDSDAEPADLFRRRSAAWPDRGPLQRLHRRSKPDSGHRCHSTSGDPAASRSAISRAPFFSEMIAGCVNWKGWN